MDKEQLIDQVAEWVDTQVIAELIVDHLEDQGDELTLENAKQCWYSELEHLGAKMGGPGLIEALPVRTREGERLPNREGG